VETRYLNAILGGVPSTRARPDANPANESEARSGERGRLARQARGWSVSARVAPDREQRWQNETRVHFSGAQRRELRTRGPALLSCYPPVHCRRSSNCEGYAQVYRSIPGFSSWRRRLQIRRREAQAHIHAREACPASKVK